MWGATQKKKRELMKKREKCNNEIKCDNTYYRKVVKAIHSAPNIISYFSRTNIIFADCI